MILSRGGNEAFQILGRRLDGVEDDDLLSDIGGVIPLLLLLRNQDNDGINLLIQLVELRVRVRGCCPHFEHFGCEDLQSGTLFQQTDRVFLRVFGGPGCPRVF